ncbi:MAG: hypothetical protein WCK90_04840 [archaeon]
MINNWIEGIVLREPAFDNIVQSVLETGKKENSGYFSGRFDDSNLIVQNACPLVNTKRSFRCVETIGFDSLMRFRSYLRTKRTIDPKIVFGDYHSHPSMYKCDKNDKDLNFYSDTDLEQRLEDMDTFNQDSWISFIIKCHRIEHKHPGRRFMNVRKYGKKLSVHIKNEYSASNYLTFNAYVTHSPTDIIHRKIKPSDLRTFELDISLE